MIVTKVRASKQNHGQMLLEKGLFTSSQIEKKLNIDLRSNSVSRHNHMREVCAIATITNLVSYKKIHTVCYKTERLYSVSGAEEILTHVYFVVLKDV